MQTRKQRGTFKALMQKSCEERRACCPVPKEKITPTTTPKVLVRGQDGIRNTSASEVSLKTFSLLSLFQTTSKFARYISGTVATTNVARRGNNGINPTPTRRELMRSVFRSISSTHECVFLRH